MRKIHQLRHLGSKRTRRRFGLSAAVFGIASVAVICGTVASGLVTADRRAAHDATRDQSLLFHDDQQHGPHHSRHQV